MQISCHQSRCHYARGYKFILSLVARVEFPFHKPHNEGIINATVSLRNKFIFHINQKNLKFNTLGRFHKHKTHANKTKQTRKKPWVFPLGLSFEVANLQNLEDPTWFEQGRSKSDGEGVQKSNCFLQLDWEGWPPLWNDSFPDAILRASGNLWITVL